MTDNMKGIEPSYTTYDELTRAHDKLRKRIGRLYNTHTSLSKIQELEHQAEVAFDNEMAAFVRRGIVVPETALPRLRRIFPDLRQKEEATE